MNRKITRRKRNSWKNTFPTIGIFLFSLLFIGLNGYLPAVGEVFVQFHGENAFHQLDPAKWREAGVDHIILRVFRNQSERGGMFFNNSQFRVLSPELKSFLNKTPADGPEIWAWMISRRFDWVNDPTIMDRDYRQGTRHALAKLDLFNPLALSRLMKVFRELAMLEPAGILIQDDLVLRSREGMSNRGLESYARTTGQTADPDAMVREGSSANRRWVELKSRQVTSVLSRLVEVCKKANPAILMGVDVYYETPIFPRRALNWYAHDLRQLVQTGVQRIFLMAYHRQMKKELKLDSHATLRMFSRMVNNALDICKERLVIKIQVRDWESGEWLPGNEIDDLFRLVPAGAAGICLTPVKPDDLSRVRELVSRYRKFMNSGLPVGKKRR